MPAPSARDPLAPRAWDGIGKALLLVALSLLAWLPSAVGAGFAFDDREAIEGNPVVEGSLPWTAAIQQDYWQHRGAAGHFRPWASLSLRLDRAVWGDQGAGFHATNVILHALVVFAAALLARRWFGREKVWPWIGLALFAVHPVLADSVAWISGRSSMLAALPGLCAAVFIVRGAADAAASRRNWLALFALGFLGTGLASLGKEDGLIWVLALPCLAAPRGRGAVAATALGCLCGAAAMFALRAEALGSFGISAPHAPLAAAATWDRLLVGGRVFLEALRLAVWPASYAPSYSGDPAFSVATMRDAPWLGILGLVAWLAMLGVALVSARRSRGIVSASACLALISWVPFLGLVPAGEVFAPRFLYLPLLFAIPLAHAGLTLAFGRRAPLVAGLALLLALGAAWSRGRVYSSRGAFRHAVLAQRPDDVPSWNDLGLFHEENGDLARARESWLHATALDPHYSRAWSNLGRIELGLGHPEAAITLLERAVQEGPRNAIAQLNLGSARMAVRDWTRAEENYRAAIRLVPGLAPAWEGLARSLRAQGREDEASEATANGVR